MNNATAATKTLTQTWHPLCQRADLVPFSGVAAWIETPEGPAQVALFYIPSDPKTSRLPGHDQELYAIDHHDPIAGANVNARGIVGDLKGELVVASPLYKHHYRLTDGQCLENPGLRLRTWAVGFEGDEVWVHPEPKR